MLKRWMMIIVFCLVSLPALAQDMRPTVIDSPSAFTIGRGGYDFSFLGYDHGGIALKTITGLHDNLYLGVSFDVASMIGRDKIHPNIPGVVAKIKFTDGWENFPFRVAVGYDSFYIGDEGKKFDSIEKGWGLVYPPYYVYKFLRIKYSNKNEYNRVIYGPYLAFTNTIFLFDAEQYFSYGIRLPVQPDCVPEDSSYFVGLDVPLGQFFRIKTEVERVFYNFRSPKKWLYNFGVRYTYLDQLAIEFDVLYQPSKGLNRVIRIEYHGEF